MRTSVIDRRVTCTGLVLAVAIALIAGCGPNKEEVTELREQQRQILAKLGALEKKIEKIGTRPAAPARRAGPDAAKAHDLPVGKSPIKGPKAAAVTITEFSDYQCPFCARSEPLIHEALEAYPEQARFVYKHFPLTSIHPHAMGAAQAAMAAQEQGKFWEMHDVLFENQRSLEPSKYEEYAKQAGLDVERFKRDLEANQAAYDKRVTADYIEGQRNDVRGTPALYIGGKKVRARTIDGMSAMIEEAAQRAPAGS